MTKPEIYDQLIGKGFSEEDLKGKNKADLQAMLEKAADESADDTGESEEKVKEQDTPKPAPPIKEKDQQVRRPTMAVPSTKMVKVVGKPGIYCNVSGGYIQDGKESMIPENVHQKLQSTGRADVLYSVK